MRDLDEVMEFQHGNHRAIESVCVLSPLQRLKGFFLGGGDEGVENLLNDMSAGAGSTLHLHTPCTVAFYNKCFEPLWRREVYVYINQVTLSQSEDILKYSSLKCITIRPRVYKVHTTGAVDLENSGMYMSLFKSNLEKAGWILIKYSVPRALKSSEYFGIQGMH